MIDLRTINNIHIVGIGGIGLSALARMLVHDGKAVTGCDRSDSVVMEELRRAGIDAAVGHDEAHLHGAELLIYSDAVWPDSPERVRAKALGIPEISFYEALGVFANASECLIAISGTHGKTSSTAMLIDVLEAAGLNPTGFVGSLRAKTNSNFRAGGSEYFVAEADEYRRHFLQYHPKILVILNIDADHLDYYKDLADIQSAFNELARKVPADGFIVCDPNDVKVAPALQNVAAQVIDYKKFYDPALPMKALSLQRTNAAAVLAVADILGINIMVARQALADFSGTWRRFEYKGKTKTGADVYDDYAHNPAKVETTLKSVRERFPDKRIIVAFHPHLYSRTKLLFNEFAAAFHDADEVLIAPIFAAREAPDPSISSEKLAKKITANGRPARALDFGAIESYLASHSKKGDLVITMGAGDIYKVAEAIVKP